MIEFIEKYIKAGLSAVPCTLADKYPKMFDNHPVIKGWKKFQKAIPTNVDKVFFKNFFDPEKYGVCIITGGVSGELDSIDIDNHLNNATDIFNDLTSIPEVQDIISTYDLPIETTKSGGYHIYFRSEKASPNMKLALDLNEKGKKIAIIETRGEGGLIVCAPSKGYNLVSGDLENIPVIQTEEKDILFEYCRSFNRVEDKKPDYKKKPYIPEDITNERPGDKFDKEGIEEAKQLLTEAGWKQIDWKNWRRPGKKKGSSATFGFLGENIFYCFSPNGDPFEANKCYSPFGILAELKFNGDYKETAKYLGERYGIKPKHKAGNIITPTKKDIPLESLKDIPETSEEEPPFWFRGKKGAVKIDYYKLKLFLEKNGFARYEINKDKFMFLRIQEGIADELNFNELRDFILNYLISIERLDIYNEFMDNSKFSSGSLSIIKKIEPNWIKDSKEKAFLFYKNCIVEVSKDSLIQKKYGEIPGIIWRSQILDREFEPIQKNEYDKADVSKFSAIVSDHKEDRINAYKEALGFLLHTYKKASYCPAIIFNDESTSDEPNGGTGKGFSVSFIQQMRNVVTINGKKFDPNDEFSFQRVNQDTNLIFVDDIKKGFVFEDLFSILTTGLPVRKLFLGEIYLPFDQAPKFAISTNYAIKGKTNSFKRRIFELEIHSYFGPERTPEDEFGRIPFQEWDAEEWQRFDNFMISCIQLYLKKGLEPPKYVALPLNKLKSETCSDFVSFADDYFSEGVYPKKDSLNDFRLETDNKYYSQHLGSRKFLGWCEAWAKYKGFEFVRKTGAAGGSMEFIDPKSNLFKTEEPPF